jgi:hypothetical protein
LATISVFPLLLLSSAMFAQSFRNSRKELSLSAASDEPLFAAAADDDDDATEELMPVALLVAAADDVDGALKLS